MRNQELEELENLPQNYSDEAVGQEEWGGLEKEWFVKDGEKWLRYTDNEDPEHPYLSASLDSSVYNLAEMR